MRKFLLAFIVMLGTAGTASAQDEFFTWGETIPKCTFAAGPAQISIDGSLTRVCGDKSHASVAEVTDAAAAGADCASVPTAPGGTSSSLFVQWDDSLGSGGEWKCPDVAPGGFNPDTDPGVNHPSYVAGHGDGGNCGAGDYPLGMDNQGAVQDCTDASIEIDSIVETHRALSSDHHVKTIDASQLSTGTIAAARVGAAHIDLLTEIAAALKSGLDADLITGTAGSDTHCAQWNADGDLVTSGATCGAGSVALTDLTDVTLTTPSPGATLIKSAGDWIDGQLDLADADAITGLLPDANIVSTIARDSELHVKTIDASELSTGTIAAARVGGAHIDLLTEIAAALKSGADAELITGTPGSDTHCAQWNADGDLVTSGAACGGGGSLASLSDVTLTTPATGATLIKSAGDWIDGQLDLADADAVTGFLPDGNIPAAIARDSELHSQTHSVDGADHTLAGGTAGEVLRATGATTFAFGALDLADADAITGLLPDANIVSTIARDSELHVKTIDASELTAGLIPAARVDAAHIDALTEIAAALKSGVDADLVTGTAGITGRCAEWNADGDLVEAVSAAPCGSGGGGSLASLSDVTLTSPATGATLIKSAGNWVDGQLDLADTDAVTGLLPDGNIVSTIARDSELHAQVHALDGADHTLAGATVGAVMRATGATTFAFGQVDLADTDAVVNLLPDANIAATIARDSELPVGANPSAALIGLTANNGSAGTFLRSDGTHALDQSISPTWTGPHQFDGVVELEGDINIGTQQMLTDASATPSVSGGAFWLTGTTTVTITDFTGTPSTGDQIYVESDGDITFSCTGADLLCGTVDIVTADGDSTTWRYNGFGWLMEDFMDVSTDMGAAHHTQVHALDGGDHTLAGATVGAVMRATGATTFAFGQVDLADADAITGLLPDANIVSTIARDSELHVKTVDASELTAGLIPAARVDAAHIDLLTEIAAALKSGDDAELITGTAGITGRCAEWNVDGDLVEAASAAPCGSGGGGSLASLSDVTLTTPATGSTLIKTATDWIDGQLDLADADAITGLLPDANIVSTIARDSELHVKTVDASELTAGLIPAARVDAAHIDLLTEIAAALKSGADAELITGTPGGTGFCAEWNVDGDLVEAASAAACGSGGGGSLASLSDVTLTSPAIGATLIKSAGDWIDGQLDLADGDAVTGLLPAANLDLTDDFVFTGDVTAHGEWNIGTVQQMTNSTTPSIVGSAMWVAPLVGQTITNFTGGTEGTTFQMRQDAASLSTLDCSSSSINCGLVDLVLALGDRMVFRRNSVNWDLVSYIPQQRDLNAIGVNSLDELSDVSITTPATGATLIKSGGDWVDGQLDLADPDAITGLLPDANIVSTIARDSELHVKTIDASELTAGLIPAARVDAAHIDLLTEIAAALKSGADAELITGTPGGTGFCAEWNVDGDLVEAASAAACGSGGSVATDAIWDVKGDLALGTGSNTAARLPVGADDTMLMADATPSQGAKWATAAEIRTAIDVAQGVHLALANPSAALIGLSANNGTDGTALRTDGTHALSQAIAPTWSARHIFDDEINLGAVGTLDGTATPTISGAVRWNTSATTIIVTAFDDGASGDWITIREVGTVNFTTLDCTGNANFRCGTDDIVMAEDDVATFIHNGTEWDLYDYKRQNQNAGPHTAANQQMVYIDGNVFSGDAGATYNDATDVLTLGGLDIIDSDGNNAITFKRNTTKACSGLTGNEFQIYGDNSAGADEMWMCDDNSDERRFARFETGTFGEEAFQLGSAAAPSTVVKGDVALDDTITSHNPLLQYFDGTQNMTIIAIPTADLNATDNDIVKYDLSGTKFTMEADATGSGFFSEADPVLHPTVLTDTFSVGIAAPPVASKFHVEGDVDEVLVTWRLDSAHDQTPGSGTDILRITDSANVFVLAIEGNGVVTSAAAAKFTNYNITKDDGVTISTMYQGGLVTAGDADATIRTFTASALVDRIKIEGDTSLITFYGNSEAGTSTYRFSDGLRTSFMNITVSAAASNENYTFDTAPAGEILTDASLASILTSVGTISSGTWQGTAIDNVRGGTGDDTSSTTGVPIITAGDWTYPTLLPIAQGGTNASTLADLIGAAELSSTAIQAGDYPAGGIDGNDVNTNIGGRSITLNTTPDPDVLDADEELYRDEFAVVITPGVMAAGEELLRKASGAITLVSLDCSANGATTSNVTVNVVECTSAGETCVSNTTAALAVTSNTANFGTVAFAGAGGANIDDADWWGIELAAITAEAQFLFCTVEYTRDD